MPNVTPTAADRLLQTLLAFEGYPERALSELAKALDLPKSTVHRLLAKLKEYGLVEQDEEGALYRLGLRAWTLALHARPYEAFRREARGLLEQLAHETGETVFLTAAEGFHSVCIARVEGHQALRVSLEIGSATPLHLGASNVILLAFSDPPVRDAAAAHWLPNAAQRAALTADLERVRRRGFAYTTAQLTPGASALAVPVLDPKGGTLIGLSVGGPAERLTEARARALVPLLQRTARQIAASTARLAAPSPRTPAEATLSE